ncbi:phosphatase PAP2 family protein [Alteribacter keqinensis]|uniref:Phosphatase PAP2 family protein n=1 Tax=Alteribacter keqinensis TaxID=2483800 RepID=A0A3M7TSD7_9BACI|nr:phosphatase PAP2 family protein [Alteribacter keqinensis]RNA68568.1 phosphatase PAP2 family protein [Alteribacter keqinensis]
MASTYKYQKILAVNCFFLFILVSVLSIQNHLTALDQVIIRTVQAPLTPFITGLMEKATKIGSGEVILIITVITGFYLIMKKMFGYTILLISLVFGGILLNFALKVLFQRERPGEMSVIEVFGYSLELSSYSFPSGHTMRSVILFSFFIYLCYQLISKQLIKLTATLFLLGIILTVSLSRIVTGAHFPTDILAAVTISIFWFYVCLIAYRKWFTVFNRKTR